ILRVMAKRPPDRYERAQDIAGAFRIALTAAGTLLDGSGCEATVSDSAASSHLFAPRPRGLFDPIWQKAEGEVKPSPVLPVVPDTPISSKRSRLGLKTSLLWSADGTETSLAGASTNDVAPPASNGKVPLSPGL